jgi:hypothetical protein
MKCENLAKSFSMGGIKQLFGGVINIPNFIVFSISFCWFLIFQTNEGLWYDECFSYFHSQGTKEDIFLVSTWDSNPPIYHFLIKLWIKLIGFSEIKLRLSSILFSTINVVILYSWIRNKLGNIASISFVLLFLLSNVQIEFANEARAYSWIFLLITISNLLFLKFLQQPRALTAICLGGLYAFIFFSHYIEGIIVPIHGIFILFFILINGKYLLNKKIDYLLKYSLGIMIFLYALYKGQIFFLNSLKLGANKMVTQPTLIDLPRVLAELLNDNYFFVFIISFISFFWVFQKIRSKKLLHENETIIVFHLFFIIFSLIVLFLVSKQTPMLTKRYLMFTTIPIFVVITFIIYSVNEKWRSYSLVIFVFLLFTFGLSTKSRFEKQMEIKEAVEFVKSNQTSNNTLIIVHTKDIVPNFNLYFDYKIFQNYFLQVEQLCLKKVIAVNEVDSLLKNLNYSYFDRVIVFRVFSSVKFQKEVNVLFREYFQKKEDINKFRGVEIQVYSGPIRFEQKSNKNLDEYFKNLCVNQFVQKIRSDLNWLESIEKKATELNRNIDSVVFEEAEWVMNEDFKRLKFPK